MDCCNFPPEYRAPYGWGETYGAYGQPYGGAPAAVPYSYGAYAPFAPDYGAPHDPYARFSAYHYGDYPPPPHRQHAALADHALLEYGGVGAGAGGGYVAKEGRTRRALARREAERARARTPAAAAVAPPHHHLPLPHTPTPPLDCGTMAGRLAGSYCDPHLSWPHYQMGSSGGWGGAWSARGGGGGGGGGVGGGGGGAHRDPLRHLAAMHDHCSLRSLKEQNMSMLDQMAPEGRSSSAPFPSYEQPPYGARASPRPRSRLAPAPPAPEYVDYSAAPAQRAPPDPPRRLDRAPAPPPATVPLPAFQQAFGSTEIGRFAEAFSRAEAAHEELAGEAFPEWDAPAAAWPPPFAQRTIKCEDPY